MHIFTNVCLRYAYYHWKQHNYHLKQQALFELQRIESLQQQRKRKYWQYWKACKQKVNHIRKTFTRMKHSVCKNHMKCIQLAYQHWKRLCFHLTPTSISGGGGDMEYLMNAVHPTSYNGLYSASSIASMKIQVLKLQSELATLSNTNELHGLLAAEKALNK